jgi:hypothetical protein
MPKLSNQPAAQRLLLGDSDSGYGRHPPAALSLHDPRGPSLQGLHTVLRGGGAGHHLGCCGSNGLVHQFPYTVAGASRT